MPLDEDRSEETTQVDSLIQLAGADQPSNVKSVWNDVLLTDLFTCLKLNKLHSPEVFFCFVFSFPILNLYLYEDSFLKVLFDMSKDRFR